MDQQRDRGRDETMTIHVKILPRALVEDLQDNVNRFIDTLPENAFVDVKLCGAGDVVRAMVLYHDEKPSRPKSQRR
jgi:hypothetical protein